MGAKRVGGKQKSAAPSLGEQRVLDSGKEFVKKTMSTALRPAADPYGTLFFVVHQELAFRSRHPSKMRVRAAVQFCFLASKWSFGKRRISKRLSGAPEQSSSSLKSFKAVQKVFPNAVQTHFRASKPPTHRR